MRPSTRQGPTAGIGHLPFGFAYINRQLAKNDAEQAALQMMRDHRTGGLLPRTIARTLNRKQIPTETE